MSVRAAHIPDVEDQRDILNPSHQSGPPPLVVARALDHRLTVTLDDPYALRDARMYGAHLIDGDDVRLTFLGESRSVYDLIDGPLGIVARAFDAAALVTAGWGAPLDDDDSIDTLPSHHPDRFRILVTTVIGDRGIASVVRDSRRPETPIEIDDRGVGRMPDSLELMWFGEVRGDADAGWFDARSVSGGRRAGRHRRSA